MIYIHINEDILFTKKIKKERKKTLRKKESRVYVVVVYRRELISPNGFPSPD